jgi:2-oxoglutarate ferredoxin oxidoreductase subunit alpha
MEKTILIGGKAGRGTAVTSHFVGKLFCSLGYYVFNYRDYPSLIRGGHNFNVLRISDKPVFSHKNKYDIILAFDQKTIDLHKKDLKKQGFVLGNKSLKAKKLISISVKSILSELNAPQIIENDIMIGWLAKYFGIDKKTLLAEAKKVFKGKKKALIIKAIEIGYGLTEKKENFKKKGSGKYFISGSSAIGVGALASGLDVYIAYTMTPATTVLHFLAGKQLKHNALVLQIENEIAVINVALACSFTGAKTMVGTSGGGLALMSEAISLAGVAELPIVIYLAQRTGPATGVPTYTAQSDLKFAVNAGHGEFTKIVVAPGDAQESITRTQEAFYLAAKHQVPVVIVGDKHVAESDYSSSELKISSISNKRFLVEKPAKNYKRYKITKSGLSLRAVPGQGPKIRATSYEHDEYGYTIEDAEKTVKMVDKRARKEKNIKKEIKALKPTSVYGKGKNLLIGWGSTKGAILDSLSELKDYRFLQVSYISPFPKKAVEREIKKSKKVILVENSSTGLLADIIAEKTGIMIKEKILKYDGRPFSPEDIIKKIKK